MQTQTQPHTFTPAQAIRYGKHLFVPPNVNLAAEGWVFSTQESGWVPHPNNNALLMLHTTDVIGMAPSGWIELPYPAYSLVSIMDTNPSNPDYMRSAIVYGELKPLTVVLQENLENLLPERKGAVLVQRIDHLAPRQQLKYLGDYVSREVQELVQMGVTNSTLDWIISQEEFTMNDLTFGSVDPYAWAAIRATLPQLGLA